MNEILNKNGEAKLFRRTYDYVADWATQNQWSIGVAEMAAGASLIAWGVHSGNVHLGEQIHGIQTQAFQKGVDAASSGMPDFGSASSIGGLGGMGIGAVAGTILGTIGVVALGGAVGVPAWIVAGGGALIFGSAGYTLTDVVGRFLAPETILSTPSSTLLSSDSIVGPTVWNASFMALGLALMLDGARRVLKDEKVKVKVDAIKDGFIWLSTPTHRIALLVGHNFTSHVKVTGLFFSRILALIQRIGLLNFIKRIIARRQIRSDLKKLFDDLPDAPPSAA